MLVYLGTVISITVKRLFPTPSVKNVHAISAQNWHGRYPEIPTAINKPLRLDIIMQTIYFSVNHIGMAIEKRYTTYLLTKP